MLTVDLDALLKRALSIKELAAVAHLGSRQVSRAFGAETGRSPAKAVDQLWVEAARLLMEQGRHSMDVIADETGSPIASACDTPSCAPWARRHKWSGATPETYERLRRQQCPESAVDVTFHPSEGDPDRA
jgi:methylphosphotriester-DNA--protein-cysteine methyltransferase